MANKKNIKGKSFFKSVANHNLERFHSETIAWIFNTFQDSAKNFIKSIHDGITSIEDIILDEKKCCWAELNQIDILLKYSYDSKNYQIIIENKMKASEHSINSQKLHDSLDKIKMELKKNNKEYTLTFLSEIEVIENNRLLSQTEYYYLREKTNHLKELVENLKRIKEETKAREYFIENFNKDYCRYVYLKPSRVNEEKFKNNNSDLKIDFDFKQLNTWNKQLGKNPWVTITYTQLINTIQKSGAIEKSEQALERYSKLIIEKKCIEDIIIANSYINFIQDNIKEEVNLDYFNENKEYARFDYFKLLFALVKANKISSNDQIDEYIEAGSSNDGMPIFAFYKEIELDEKYTFFSDSSKNNIIIKPTINVGIQIQGENFKYYVAADDYDNTKVLKIQNNSNKSDLKPDLTKNYGEFVQKILKEISEDSLISNLAKEKADFTKYKNEGFNPNKTKSFYSRSYKIKNFIESEDGKNRDIFDVANEITERVNHFVNFDILTIIKNFK
jgi:hypothetical protein